MKEEKKKAKNNNSNNNDDLKFTPLDINPSLNMGNSKLNSINPPNALDGISINSDCNNIYIGFPPLGLNSSKYSPSMSNTSMNTSNMGSPFIANSNMAGNNMNTPYMGTPNMGNANMNNANMTSSTLLNPALNSNNTTGYYPAMPYPNNIPSMDTSNTMPITSANQNMLNNEFPSEPASDDLYSYNTNDSRNISYYLPSVNPLDILRNFDFSLSDDDSRDSASNKEIDEIFECIKTNNSAILSTLKAYRIPLPIASLLIKKIIKTTLEHK